MCCDGWDYFDSKVGQCPACDGDINSDGDATQGCNHSPIQCDCVVLDLVMILADKGG